MEKGEIEKFSRDKHIDLMIVFGSQAKKSTWADSDFDLAIKPNRECTIGKLYLNIAYFIKGRRGMQRKLIVNKVLFICLLSAILTCSVINISRAGISKIGPDAYCNLCHVGGNSTEGSTVKSCAECHSSTSSETIKVLGNTDIGEVRVPIVYNALPPENPLAGGNFYWVAQGDDTKGHNIFEGNPDENWDQAPGSTIGSCGLNSCHESLHNTVLEGLPGLVGRQGCTKCHMVSDTPGCTGFHHSDDSNIIVGSEPDDPDGFFRFLSGHMSGTGHGVCGIEDNDWQATRSSTDHNEYLGFAGTKTSAGNFSALGHTMTGFCCGCHGNYHIQQDGSGNWIGHHPSDHILPGSSPYADYTLYDPDVPIARPYLSIVNDYVIATEDMVMCLTCHVAHGSSYAHNLRWELTGCLKCHGDKYQCIDDLVARAKPKKVQLTWTHQVDADCYHIYRNETPDVQLSSENRIFSCHVTTYATYVDKNVATGTVYYYKVSKIVDGKEVCVSNEVTAKPSPKKN